MIERQLQCGPLVHQREAGEMIISPDQQREVSNLLPVPLDPGVGEAAFCIDLAVRAADRGEFREVVQVELQQAIEYRPLRGRRLDRSHARD